LQVFGFTLETLLHLSYDPSRLRLVILDISRTCQCAHTSSHRSDLALAFQTHAVPRDLEIKTSPAQIARAGLGDADFPIRSVNCPLAVFGFAESFGYTDCGREIADSAAGDYEVDSGEGGAGRVVGVVGGLRGEE
jgi:hypothetical protein